MRSSIDLGAFAISVPEVVHGQDGIDVRFHGFGGKLQLFPFAERSGLVLGVHANLARALVRREGTALAALNAQFSLGIDCGYRIDVVGAFYATPWLGLSYALGAEDATLAGERFEASPWIVFPAVHVGYRFR